MSKLSPTSDDESTSSNASYIVRLGTCNNSDIEKAFNIKLDDSDYEHMEQSHRNFGTIHPSKLNLKPPTVEEENISVWFDNIQKNLNAFKIDKTQNIEKLKVKEIEDL